MASHSHATNDFRHFSEGIVSDFLQTIMVVDDELFFPSDKREGFKQLKTPGAPAIRERAGAVRAATFRREIGADAEAIDPGNSETEAHKLNAKKLIEDFGIKGIVCAAIKPSQVEVQALDEIVYPLAKNSDIVVFDWVLHGAQDGAKVKELVNEIAKQSSVEDSRVRLVVIYTGQQNLANITDEIKDSLERTSNLTVHKVDDYTLETGPVRVAVFAKSNASIGADHPELAQRMVSISEMPAKLVSEFTDMTMGLVSNVAIASLATLRANTHKLLNRFHSGLDAPFVAHGAMLKQPQDAANLLLYLIGSELTAILDGKEISKLADGERIRKWLQMKEAGGCDFAARFPNFSRENTIEDVVELVQKGVESKDLRPALTMFAKNPHKKELTAKLADPGDSHLALEYQFARLTSIKSDYRLRFPALMPGTLLKQITVIRGKRRTFYWVCIQPVCDSVRLTEKRSFPLIQLVPSDEKFDLVLPTDKNNYVSVRTLFNPFKSAMQEFAPSKDGSQVVRAQQVSGKFYFRATNGRRYQWIAELKFEHAQRIVNQYAYGLSRVGLDESEWLRRWGT